MPRTSTTFKPGCKRLPGAGRKKGTPNRFTTVKQAFLNAFEGMGGEEQLIRWGRKNPSKFYPLLAKMLPSHIENSPPERPDLSELSDERLREILEASQPFGEKHLNDEKEKAGQC